MRPISGPARGRRPTVLAVTSRSWVLRATILRVAVYAVLVFLAQFAARHAVSMVDRKGWAWDSRAYYDAFEGGLYSGTPGKLGSFNYTPVVAQVLWPFTHLPWVVFATVTVVAAAVGVWWLLRPLGWFTKTLGWCICSVQIASGNIDWLLAVAAVLGVTRGGPWVVTALTKMTPTWGPVWLVVRGEWRLLARFAVTLAVVVGVSVATVPHLWVEWAGFVREHSGEKPGMFRELVPPLWLRLGVALALVVLGARTSRRWTIPVAMLCATPVPGTGPWALLAGLPRMLEMDRAERARQAAPAGPGTSVDDRLDAVDQDLLGERGRTGDPGAGDEVGVDDPAARRAL